MTSTEIANMIRRGELDCNNQELFFSILIKGLMARLDDDITIRGSKVPHIIINTGDEQPYLDIKGQDQSLEPLEISNEDYVYNVIPRCVVQPKGISVEPDQVSNPYSNGVFQYETESSIYTLTAEFRRMPIKLNIDLKYYTSTYTELLELMQQILTKLCFIRTFKITYMGQMITCSYSIPQQLEGEYLTDLDETTQDNRSRTMSLSLEVETNLPVFSPRTVVPTDKVISSPTMGLGGVDGEIL